MTDSKTYKIVIHWSDARIPTMTIPGTTAEFKTQFMFAVDAMKPFQNERGGNTTWINPAQIAYIEISEE